MQIFRAVPDGSLRARSQASWLRAVQEYPELAGKRADFYDNLMAIAWLLARHADWSLMTSRPTWAVLIERSGLSKSVVADRIRWLRERGLLGTVTGGSTVRFRRGTQCGALDDGLGNLAAEYVLAVPDPATEQRTARSVVDLTRTPSGFSSEGGKPSPRTHVREGAGNSPALPAPADHGWGAVTGAPRSRAKDRALLAARAVRGGSLDLRRLSDRHVRHLIKVLVVAGWRPADVLYALDHTPDGRPWPFAGMAKHPAGWARHRLAAWHDVDGLPLPSRSQLLATAAARQRAEQRAAAAARDTLEAARIEVAVAARRARTLLAAASPRAAEVIARAGALRSARPVIEGGRWVRADAAAERALTLLPRMAEAETVLQASLAPLPSPQERALRAARARARRERAAAEASRKSTL